MSAFTTPIVNFSKGEIGPQLYSRIDASQYTTALKKARNVIVQRYGGVTSRPGTRLIRALAQQDKAARLVPFQYSIDQAYVLLFQQAIAEPLAFGGYILEADDLKILSATLTNPVVLEIPYHAFAVGDELHIRGLTGMHQLESRLVTITAVPDANHVAINVNGTSFAPLTDSTGTVRIVAPPPPPPPPPPPSPSPPPPPPPDTGDGGGSGSGLCVVDTTLIDMANGDRKEARFVVVGDVVRTKHEQDPEGSFGEYRVAQVEQAWMPVFKADGYPRATAEHPFYINGAWVQMDEIGEPDGEAWVMKIEVEDAHTYISDGVLSHNKSARYALP